MSGAGYTLSLKAAQSLIDRAVNQLSHAWDGAAPSAREELQYMDEVLLDFGARLERLGRSISTGEQREQ